jgi:uncharacterized protein (TIGR02147 family)
MTKEIYLFNYSDYRDYLRDYLDLRRTLEKGVQTKLAHEMGCQPAYVSKVLAKDAHFSLEQAERVSHFCHHTEIEKHFYLLITQQVRAATPQLKKFFTEQIQTLRLKNKSLKEHMKLDMLSDLETQIHYYGSWTIATIHVLLTIPSFQTRQEICSKLNLSILDVSKVIDFLKSKGMVEENSGRLKVGAVGLHLGSDSPIIKQHHHNWRLKAMDAIVRNNEDDLHYSSVVSLSVEDRERFRAELVKWIANFRKEVSLSKEEDLAAICIDFFYL